jgi:hypothetical protein
VRRNRRKLWDLQPESLFSSFKPFLWAVSPTFAVLSQAVGSGVLIEWFEISGSPGYYLKSKTENNAREKTYIPTFEASQKNHTWFS